MKSIREIYNIGYGPSSSHTMGPSRAAGLFFEKNPGAEKVQGHTLRKFGADGERPWYRQCYSEGYRPSRCCRDRLETGYQSAPAIPMGCCSRLLYKGIRLIVGRYIVWVEAHCGTSWVLSTTEISTRRQVWPR